ncbi:hypothetical protein ACQWHW_24650, partial [Salmonella enterica subsp. enterica serovar Infantis]
VLNVCLIGVGNRRRAARQERAAGAAFLYTLGFLELNVGLVSRVSLKYFALGFFGGCFFIFGGVFLSFMAFVVGVFYQHDFCVLTKSIFL